MLQTEIDALLKKFSEAAQRLLEKNRSIDVTLQEIESRLAESKIELAFWIKTTPSDNDADMMELGFAKVGKRWQFALRSSPAVAKEQSSVARSPRKQFPTALLRASRELRTKAFCAMPEFLEQFRVHLDRRADDIEAANHWVAKVNQPPAATAGNSKTGSKV
jgi:hypothetical protein